MNQITTPDARGRDDRHGGPAHARAARPEAAGTRTTAGDSGPLMDVPDAAGIVTAIRPGSRDGRGRR
jgi:hypothetical protein